MSGHAKNPCPTHLILECIDPAEYAALVDAAKDGLRIILSCGTINATPGNIVITHLYQIFPSGATKTALDSLFANVPYTPPG